MEKSCGEIFVLNNTFCQIMVEPEEKKRACLSLLHAGDSEVQNQLLDYIMGGWKPEQNKNPFA